MASGSSGQPAASQPPVPSQAQQARLKGPAGSGQGHCNWLGPARKCSRKSRALTGLKLRGRRARARVRSRGPAFT